MTFHDPESPLTPHPKRAAQAAPAWDSRPVIEITSPADGEVVSGMVDISANASDDHGVAQVTFSSNGMPISTDTDGSNGWSAVWDTATLAGGAYSLTTTATDTRGATAVDHAGVFIEPNRQGDWVGNYGAAGYILSSWNGTAGDLAVLPSGVTYVIEQGARSGSWPSPTTDVRALESPNESERRARTWHHATQLRVRLNFAAAYTGTLHLYAVDWDSSARRQTVTVNDGRGSQVVGLTSSFDGGAWMHYDVAVNAGGSVVITADWTGGNNAVLSGIFFGGPR